MTFLLQLQTSKPVPLTWSFSSATLVLDNVSVSNQSLIIKPIIIAGLAIVSKTFFLMFETIFLFNYP